MTKIIILQLVKVTLTALATTTLVYFGLRLAAGDPELARRGIVSNAAPATSDSTTDRDSAAPAAADRDPATPNLAPPPPSVGERALVLLRAYPRWLARVALFRFERSYYSDLRPGQLIAAQIGRTALLALASFALALLLAIGLTALRARLPGRFIAATLTIGSRVTITIPEFWLAMILLFCFSIYIPIFPLFGSDSIAHYILPLLTLALSRGAVLFAILNAEARRHATAEYVLSARVRGIPPWRIAWRYQLRNALTALIPISVIQFGYLFGGAVLVEQVFGISGFGTLLLHALQRRDYPVAEASVYLIALIFSLLGIAADVARVTVDPRLRAPAR